MCTQLTMDKLGDIFFTEYMFADVAYSVSTHVVICSGAATQKIPSQWLSLTYVNMQRITIVGVKNTNILAAFHIWWHSWQL